MTKSIIHRGPDDEGIWMDSDARLAFGFRRLSIIDLSPEGHQPMISASGRYVIAFNGEIYNFRDLRPQLGNYRFRGASDTEVMLAAFEEWGVENAAVRFTGMFAFAVYDRVDHTLYLYRDRLGEKPLYYGWVNKSFVFGSELKVFRCFPGFKNNISKTAESLFFQFSYVPTPLSIYENIFKLPPGSFLKLKIPLSDNANLDSQKYWDANRLAEFSPMEISESHATIELEKLLTKKISQQMISDVPLGVFLSGGVDSTVIAALMQKQSGSPIKTFTVGFSESQYDESKKAAKIARYLGTNHTEINVKPDDVLKIIPNLPQVYDEPFADSSQLPTLLICQLAKKYVTVVLSGDGGDEVFGGYNRYFWAPKIWNFLSSFSDNSRTWWSEILSGISPKAWDLILFWSTEKTPTEKLNKLLRSLPAKTDYEFYIRLSSHQISQMSRINPIASWYKIENFSGRMMMQDLLTYLPDDILVKVDRAGMSNSLETRIPYLDHEIVEFIWRLPTDFKLRDGQGKWILKQLASDLVPQKMLMGPKQGFAVPLDSWLRGPLKEWGHDLILRCGDDHAKKLWEEHQSGIANWQYFLWDRLVYQAWSDYWTKVQPKVQSLSR